MSIHCTPECTPHVRSVVACTQHAVFSYMYASTEFELTHELLKFCASHVSNSVKGSPLSRVLSEVVGQYRTEMSNLSKTEI